MSSRYLVLIACASMALADETTTDQHGGLPPQDKVAAALTACADIDREDACYNHCLYKHQGIVDEEGRYVEEAVVDMLRAGTSIGKVTEHQAKKMAKQCNSLNDDIKKGCDRAQQVSGCIYRMLKLYESQRREHLVH